MKIKGMGERVQELTDDQLIYSMVLTLAYSFQKVMEHYENAVLVPEPLRELVADAARMNTQLLNEINRRARK